MGYYAVNPAYIADGKIVQCLTAAQAAAIAEEKGGRTAWFVYHKRGQYKWTIIGNYSTEMKALGAYSLSTDYRTPRATGAPHILPE